MQTPGKIKQFKRLRFKKYQMPYTAPEIKDKFLTKLRIGNDYFKSDVFSLGILLLQMGTLSNPEN